MMDVVSIGETLVCMTSEPRGLMRHATSFVPRVAGAETNTLIGLSRLGHQTSWMSKLGYDEFGKMVLSTIRGEGVDTSQVTFSQSKSTGIFFKEIIHENDVRISYFRKNSAASQIKSSDLDEATIKKAKYLYVTGITPLLSDVNREMTFKAIDIAKGSGVQTVFDPNIRKNLLINAETKKVLKDIIRAVDIVLPGISEASILLNNGEPEELAAQLLKMGPSLVVIKLGKKGAYFASKNNKSFVPSFHVKKVLDPVGAGDAFAAGFLSGLLDKLDLKDAVSRACALGALVTMTEGDYEGLPDRESLQKFMKQENEEDISR